MAATTQLDMKGKMSGLNCRVYRFKSDSTTITFKAPFFSMNECFVNDYERGSVYAKLSSGLFTISGVQNNDVVSVLVIGY